MPILVLYNKDWENGIILRENRSDNPRQKTQMAGLWAIGCLWAYHSRLNFYQKISLSTNLI